MRNTRVIVATIICILTCVYIDTTKAANILVIVPMPSYSHQVYSQAIWINLSQRGHKVVLVTTDPINDPSLTNLTEIDMRAFYSMLNNLKYTGDLDSDTWLNIVHQQLWPMSKELQTKVYEHPEMRKMYAPDSGVTFDAVIVEVLLTPALYLLAHRFNAPLIGIISLGIPMNGNFVRGEPILPSHPSNWEMEQDVIAEKLSFWQRSKNFIRAWYHLYRSFNHFLPEQQALAEKYLGKNIPSISDMERNISITLQNQEEIISYIKPKMPNVISFGSLHVLRKGPPLSNDLKRFLDDAPNGFVYFSLGTNILMSIFPRYTIQAINEVFASLPCKVLWKTNIEIPIKSDNIYTASWFPQQSILAHPKLRLFVYQGGLQSTEEAIHHVVPLLGIPMCTDQYSQVSKMISLGVARQIESSTFSKEVFDTTIRYMLNNTNRYRERMLNLKAMINDKPYKSINNVIWWIEYVIRHKGITHLRSTIANYPWYQRYDMDVIAFLSIVMFVALLCILMIMQKIFRMILHYVKILSCKKVSFGDKKKEN